MQCHETCIDTVLHTCPITRITIISPRSPEAYTLLASPTATHFRALVAGVRDWTDQPASIAFHLDICPTNPRQGSDALPAYLQVTIQYPF